MTKKLSTQKIEKTCPLEDYEQEQFCNYLRSHDILFTSTQNGSVFGTDKRKFGLLQKLYKTGMQKGFMDMIIFARNKSKTDSVLFIEMKRQFGGKVSTEQKEWISKLSNAGYSVGVAKGCDSAIRILNKYLSS